MNALLPIIQRLIGERGPLTIAEYMELALQHPEFGYYRSGDPLGRAGDFVTAPEISQMFGEMIGLWCANVWRHMGTPQKFALLEMGPGRGTLMQDALRATAKIPGFHQAMRLCLMESNVTLREAQQKKLAPHEPHYIESLEEPPVLPTICIANEFFDALPIRQFEKTFQGWCERFVAVENDELAFTLQTLDPALLALIPENLREAMPGTVYEVSMPSLVLMRDLSRHIKAHTGAALIIDYGYSDPTTKPTLQAVANHQSVDVLERPGEVDLTAHVDFSLLRRTAAMQNLSTFGPVGQGEFLQALGIDLRASQLKQRAAAEQMKDIDVALHRLTDSAEMGTLFKVMAVATAPLTDLVGF